MKILLMQQAHNRWNFVLLSINNKQTNKKGIFYLEIKITVVKL